MCLLRRILLKIVASLYNLGPPCNRKSLFLSKSIIPVIMLSNAEILYLQGKNKFLNPMKESEGA